MKGIKHSHAADWREGGAAPTQRQRGPHEHTDPSIIPRSEMQLLMRALRDMNVSKLVGDDLPLFLSMVEDVFPGQKLERMQLGDVQAMLKTVRAAVAGA